MRYGIELNDNDYFSYRTEMQGLTVLTVNQEWGFYIVKAHTDHLPEECFTAPYLTDD